ncbi:MAG: site-specific integrase [Magnetococcales bacterium]|nr:site-specific integrase [Magnetococcales bacterium]
MSLYKRGDIWWCKFKIRGKTIRCSSGTTDINAARAYEAKIRAEHWREDRLDERPEILWEVAAVRYLEESSGKAGYVNEKGYIRFWDKHLRGMRLSDIDRLTVQRLAEKKAKKVSPATVNRHLACLRSLLNKAEKKWDWLDKAPSISMLKEPRRRIRYLTQEQAGRLLDELPPHLEAIVRFALATGLRESNITSLRWSEVDLERKCAWAYDDQMKNRTALAIPLNADAVEVLRGQIGKHHEFVFTYKGEPVTRANNHAWRKALKRAGIVDFRFHDLRHTWASWHAQEGTPMHALRELGGWKSEGMVNRYAHLSSEHLMPFADKITLKRGGTKKGTEEKIPALKVV